MVIAALGVGAWLVHAVLSCMGRRSTAWFLLWLVGIPVLCLLDYLVFALFVFDKHSGGIADAHPAADGLVLNLFVGLALTVVLVLLEPVLLLVDVLVGRRRAAWSASRTSAQG